jgi:glycosyltransferase involved in cell wall biosynthesis
MKIGIYLAYSPMTKFENQGLGRLLAELVVGFSQQTGQTVTIVCPSWLRPEMAKMFGHLPADSVEVIGNQDIPKALWIRQRLSTDRGAAGRGRLAVLGKQFLSNARRITGMAVTTLAKGLASRNLFLVSVAALVPILIVIFALPLLLPLAVIGVVVWLVIFAARAVQTNQRMTTLARKVFARLKAALGTPSDVKSAASRYVYEQMLSQETADMQKFMRQRRDVEIWYSPTVFWPEINSAGVPTVQCFPDMVVSDFPTKFALKLPHSVASYRPAKRAIETGRHFVAYSHSTAKTGLQNRFNVAPERIHVIPHAAMDLAPHIAIKGTLDDHFARDKFAANLIDGFRATRWQGSKYLKDIDLTDISYLFFPSQIRPNKNYLNLIRAYEIVLRKRYRHTKLVVTADFHADPEIFNYIRQRRLQYEIIPAYDLPSQVLAAFYHRAALVVNPTFYEGGFPFTFSEGMSVGTPSVMSRIPQTEEVITGDLAKVMLFDPLSPEDMADRIVFGLDNKEQLLQLQTPLYETLKQRTWQHVARDHIDVFAKILQENDSR